MISLTLKQSTDIYGLNGTYLADTSIAEFQVSCPYYKEQNLTRMTGQKS